MLVGPIHNLSQYGRKVESCVHKSFNRIIMSTTLNYVNRVFDKESCLETVSPLKAYTFIHI